MFDVGGRIKERQVTALGMDIDGSVRRVELEYTNRGQTLTVDQYDATSGGSALNGVKYSYDEWGNVLTLAQDFDSAVASSSGNEKTVSWAYSRVDPTNGRLSYRRVSETLADGKAVTFGYGSGGGIDDLAGRVSTVSLNATGSALEIAAYQYMGSGMVVKKTLTEAGLSVGSGPSELDRFNRITKDAWLNGSSNAVQEFDVSYDRNSNITMVKDPVLDNNNGTVSFIKSFSTGFTMDDRNRVTRGDRGVESSGSITGTQRLNQLWTLSQTGNWTDVKNDLNGDSDAIDTNETDDARTFNNANETLTRTVTGSSAVTLLHDRSGEMTDDAKHFKFVYDGFGRLKKVTDRAGTPALVAEYTYNGLNQRIGWHYDADPSGTAGVNSSDPWYFFTYDDRWRIVNTFRVSSGTVDANAKERFVHHAAGLDGRGGSSYIDSMIVSDRDNSTTWITSGDGDLEKRFYYLQNWRADTCAIANDGGLIARHFRYSAYGSRTEVNAADFNRDGVSDFFDYLDFVDGQSGSDARTDFNRDGVLDGFDYSDFVDVRSSDGSDISGGKTRNLYAGYENDPSLEILKAAGGSGGDSGLAAFESMYHVRNRVYSTELGRWTRRDPLGYIDGMGLEEYCKSMAGLLTDPSGLIPYSSVDDCVQRQFDSITTGREHDFEDGLQLRRSLQACCNALSMSHS